MMYRFDIIVNIAFGISKIVLAYVLWGAIFEQRDTVAGFTFDGMMTYYIISSFILQLDQSTATAEQIASEIREGQFSKYIIKPINSFMYFTSKTAGVSVFMLIFNIIATLVWLLVFKVNIQLTESIYVIFAGVGMCLLGLLFMMQLNFFIGILAFKFIDTWLFIMIKDNLVQFLTGAFIPLAILPTSILNVLRFSPFYYTSYLPSMLFVGQNLNEIGAGVIVLLAWNTIFWIINKLTYSQLKFQYEGVGV